VVLDESTLRIVFLLHLAATLIMVGVIWIVQIVHYPLFSAVGADGFAIYQAEHGRRITVIVGPLMLFELATAALFVVARPPSINPSLAWIGLALVIAIWLSTVLLQVPQHSVLGGGFDAAAHRALVLTNWIRTAAWTARGVLVLYLAAGLLR
jgi:hypothetical protein